jgi:RNA polymerase sigma factor (sigma-70 family)
MANNRPTLPEDLLRRAQPPDYTITWQLLLQHDPATVLHLYDQGYSVACRYLEKQGKPRWDVHQDAQDLIQTAFARFLVYCANIPIDPAKPPLAVLFNCLKFVWYEYLREKKRHKTVSSDPARFFNQEDDTERRLAEKLMADTQERCLLEAFHYDLKSECRQVIHLKYFEKQSHAAIAALFNRKANYSKQRLFNCSKYLEKAARQRLRNRLSEL